MRIGARAGPVSVSSSASVPGLVEGMFYFIIIGIAVVSVVVVALLSIWVVPMFIAITSYLRLSARLVGSSSSWRDGSVRFAAVLFIGCVIVGAFILLSFLWVRLTYLHFGDECRRIASDGLLHLKICSANNLSGFVSAIPMLAFGLAVLGVVFVGLSPTDEELQSYRESRTDIDEQDENLNFRLTAVRILSSYAALAMAATLGLVALAFYRVQDLGFDDPVEMDAPLIFIRQIGGDRYEFSTVVVNAFGYVAVLLGVFVLFSMANFRWSWISRHSRNGSPLLRDFVKFNR